MVELTARYLCITWYIFARQLFVLRKIKPGLANKTGRMRNYVSVLKGY